ncbi:hypothetical protein E2C01_000457 [Portunus trituberculatus]|uniref:Uncharacterized protein n=1 Tax=Portunus trituberculatus TaxID=210409 RepID=A0A5B7CED7_PORTR|nr:hypothetical protein [Portunus trituberculatus]
MSGFRVAHAGEVVRVFSLASPAFLHVDKETVGDYSEGGRREQLYSTGSSQHKVRNNSTQAVTQDSTLAHSSCLSEEFSDNSEDGAQKYL